MLVLGPLCSYTGGEDYFTHNAGGYDFHRDPEPNCHQSNCSQVAWEDKGKYSTIVFAEEAVNVVQAHPTTFPLFLYLAFQAVHARKFQHSSPSPSPSPSLPLSLQQSATICDQLRAPSPFDNTEQLLKRVAAVSSLFAQRRKSQAITYQYTARILKTKNAPILPACWGQWTRASAM